MEKRGGPSGAAALREAHFCLRAWATASSASGAFQLRSGSCGCTGFAGPVDDADGWWCCALPGSCGSAVFWPSEEGFEVCTVPFGLLTGSPPPCSHRHILRNREFNAGNCNALSCTSAWQSYRQSTLPACMTLSDRMFTSRKAYTGTPQDRDNLEHVGEPRRGTICRPGPETRQPL